MKIQTIIIISVLVLFFAIGLSSGAELSKTAATKLVKNDVNLGKIVLDPMTAVLNDYATFIETPVNTGGGPKALMFKLTSNQEDGTVTYVQGFVTYDEATNSLIASGDQFLNTNTWTCTQVCSCNPSGGMLDVNSFPFNPKQLATAKATIDISSKKVTMSNGDSFTLEAGPTGVFFGETGSKVYTISFFKKLEIIS